MKLALSPPNQANTSFHRNSRIESNNDAVESFIFQPNITQVVMNIPRKILELITKQTSLKIIATNGMRSVLRKSIVSYCIFDIPY
jgi:hypothetical protein